MKFKSKNALKHDKANEKKRLDLEQTNHFDIKKDQIERFFQEYSREVWSHNRILELFPGNGKLTVVWRNWGSVLSNNKQDAYTYFHRLIADGEKFEIIDIDPYGFPSRLFPDIFLLIDHGYLFLTFPIISINVLNGITQEHLRVYYGSPKPSLFAIEHRIKDYGLCHWRHLDKLYMNKIGKRMWRFCFKVTKVKATEYMNVRNQPDRQTSQTLLNDYEINT